MCARRTGGPGVTWYDVETTLGAIETHHQVVCTITVTRVPRSVGLLEVVLSAVESPAPGREAKGVQQRRVSVARDYLAEGSTEMAPMVFRMCLDLDRACDKTFWEQKRIPGV